MPIEAGQQLLHYRLIEKIGAGGMGEVWKAVDTALDREVAIKLLPDALASEPDRMARFEREAKLLASLKHTNIAAVYGLHEAEGTRFLAMELVPGEDLADRLARGPLPVEQAIEIALRMTEALEAAHEHGVIHRDLKPANVRVGPRGEVKVLDFGLAKALAPAQSDPGAEGTDQGLSPTVTSQGTAVGMILGTAAYMSPEQAKGEEADRRADIWSFGIVLCEMLTGNSPFKEQTVSETLAAVLKSEPDLSALPSSVPTGIRRLLDRCLQKNSRQRLHDIADARLEIEAVLRGDETTAADPAREKARATTRGWKIAATIASVVAVVALATHLPTFDTGAPPRTASRFTLTISPSDSYSTLQNCALAFSPDGRTLAYAAAPQDPGAISEIYLQRFDRFEPESVPDTLGGYGPFFSPDGKWVGYFQGNAMWKKPVRGGSATRLATVAGTARGADWIDDDRIFYSPNWFSPIFQVSASGGEPRQVTHLAEGEKSHRFPSALPDGRAVIFTVGRADTDTFDDASIVIQSIASGEREVLVEGGSFGRFVPPDRLLYGRRGSLFVARLDVARLKLTGPAEPVLDDLLTSPTFGSSQFAVSRNGTLAYLAGSPELFNSRVVEVSRNGEFTELPLPPRPYSMAVPSADGKRLALRIDAANGQLWIYDTERGTMSRVTREWDADYPSWRLDGQALIYVLSKGGSSAIAQVQVDGTGEPEILWKGGSNITYTTWAPDGRSVVFSDVDPETDFDLWVLDLDGEPTVSPYLKTPAQETDPAISPDGNWLAYTSDQSGRDEIYVQAFPNPGRRWQISAQGGTGAVWSPSDGELLFKTGEEILAVPVELGETFRAGIPRPLFKLPNAQRGDDTRSFGVSANGRYLALLPPEGWQPTGRLHLVLDWVGQLGRFERGN